VHAVQRRLVQHQKSCTNICSPELHVQFSLAVGLELVFILYSHVTRLGEVYNKTGNPVLDLSDEQLEATPVDVRICDGLYSTKGLQDRRRTQSQQRINRKFQMTRSFGAGRPDIAGFIRLVLEPNWYRRRFRPTACCE